ncbi:MAG: STAS domain-containing protein [Bacteroidaceae bacterium]
MDNSFNVREEGSHLFVELQGRLDTNNAPLLMEKLSAYKGKGLDTVVFDATKLIYIASSGIRTIIFVKQKLGSNPKIVFLNCSDDVKNVFTMTGLQNYIDFKNK